MLDTLTFTPVFPAFQGPYNVGSIELEIPVADIEPNDVSLQKRISTVKARVFYPTSSKWTTKSQPCYWIPQPQQDYVTGFAKFLGASDRLAKAMSFVPSWIKRSKIPAMSDAPVMDPGQDQWPVAVFSHGLGGNINTYSYLVGSLASCGMVVIAPEHRDGSAPITLIHNSDQSVTSIVYKRLPHKAEPEVLQARNEQLRHRMTELDLIYSVVERLQAGDTFTNLAVNAQGKLNEGQTVFKSLLDLSPGKVTWMGHSFGAATITQFVKSVYWGQTMTKATSAEPRFCYAPRHNSSLAAQITPRSPVILLDLWAMPLTANESQWLYSRPLPCFDGSSSSTSTVLSIMSQQFYNISSFVEQNKRILSGDPNNHTSTLTDTDSENPTNSPRLFYVPDSLHLSQSDFGLMFPWALKKFMGAIEPERTMNLNLRAILQLLRENEIQVEGIKLPKEDLADKKLHDGNDEAIFSSHGDVRSWKAIPIHA